jgi:hypothetical protein
MSFETKTGCPQMSDRLSMPPDAPDDADLIAALKAQIEAQQAIIDQQAASLAHSRKIFDRSSAAARIGVWECDLSDESLVWTDVVYDIFDLPRGSKPIREADARLLSQRSRSGS